MNPGRFFIPNFYMPKVARFGNINPFIRNSITTNSNSGIISRLFRTFRSFNWRGLISGANRTLNVVNQTIPLIRQAKPMVNNVKSMMQLAKAFGNETKNKKNISNKTINNKTNSKKSSNISYSNKDNTNYPIFFV